MVFSGVACYYSSWAVYRQGPGNFNVELIDPSACSHIIYAFIGLHAEGDVYLLDEWNDVGDDWHEGKRHSIIPFRGGRRPFIIPRQVFDLPQPLPKI